MRGFTTTVTFKIMVAIVIALLLLVVISATTGNSIIGDIIGYFTTPVQQVTAEIAGGRKPGYNELLEENEELQERVDELTYKLIDYNNMKRENDQYKEFLELKELNPDYQLVKANVVGRSPLELFYGFTIDEGSLAGIKVNDVVMTSSGLVGRVIQVNMTHSVVSTIFDPATQVGAIDSETNDIGVISSTLEYADRKRVKMIYLSAQHEINPGDHIITSGLSGIFPKGILIGTVERIGHEENDVTYYADIKPAVDIEQITYVMVIVSYKGQGEIVPETLEPITAEVSIPDETSAEEEESAE